MMCPRNSTRYLVVLSTSRGTADDVGVVYARYTGTVRNQNSPTLFRCLRLDSHAPRWSKPTRRSCPRGDLHAFLEHRISIQAIITTVYLVVHIVQTNSRWAPPQLRRKNEEQKTKQKLTIAGVIFSMGWMHLEFFFVSFGRIAPCIRPWVYTFRCPWVLTPLQDMHCVRGGWNYSQHCDGHLLSTSATLVVVIVYTPLVLCIVGVYPFLIPC